MNEWPGGKRHAMSQSEHERWNGSHFPGTRQLCYLCESETGYCEEDGIWTKDGNPLCDECAEKHPDIIYV